MVKKKDLCILHIGMPKTGSSTIQNNFFKYIKDSRAVYTNLGHPNQSGHLYGLFLENTENYHYFIQKNFTQTDIESFRQSTKKILEKSFTDHSSSINILSGEALYHATKNEVNAMKLYLNNFFKNILVVTYVRPTQSLCSSAFQQHVKHPLIDSFLPRKIYHKYNNIANYDEVYGKENVLVIPFLPKYFPDGDIVKDFCKYTGLKEQESEIKRSNEAMSKAAVSILFTSNYYKNIRTNYGHLDFSIQNILVEKLRTISDEKFQFSGELIQRWVEDHFTEDYAWLLDRIGKKYAKYFAIDPQKKGIATELELMEYATTYIDQLKEYIDPASITFEIQKNPKTVALLVDILRKEIMKAIQ